MPSRRLFLATGASLALSGCAALDGAAAKLTRLRLENNGTSTQEFILDISLDGTSVYTEAHRVAATGSASTAELTDEVPTERGRLTVATELPAADVTQSTTFGDDRCYDVIVEYTGDDLIHWQNGSHDGCDTNSDER